MTRERKETKQRLEAVAIQAVRKFKEAEKLLQEVVSLAETNGMYVDQETGRVTDMEEKVN